jgi:hypothetical protein
MTQTNVSRSALNVALARTHLTWLGVIDDPDRTVSLANIKQFGLMYRAKLL